MYSEAVRRGGTLVSVRTENSQTEKVNSILGRYQPIDPVQQGMEYSKTGWNQFEMKAAPYESTKTAAERIRRTS